MTRAALSENGPASAPTLPVPGSTVPLEENNMNTCTDSTPNPTGKYLGAGRYEVESFGVRKVVWLDPVPEPARAYLDEDTWLQWSETEELRAGRGNFWSRLDIIESLIVHKVKGGAR